MGWRTLRCGKQMQSEGHQTAHDAFSRWLIAEHLVGEDACGWAHEPKTGIKDVPREILRPQDAWASSGKSAEEFNMTALNLAGLFKSHRCHARVRVSPVLGRELWRSPLMLQERVAPNLYLASLAVFCLMLFHRCRARVKVAPDLCRRLWRAR